MNERPGQTVEEEEDTDDDEAEAESSNTLLSFACETNPTPRHADPEQGSRRERNIDR